MKTFQWKVQDSQLLAWAVSKMKECRLSQKSSENISEREWEQVSTIYMHGVRSASECRKRWLFLTKSQGQKHLWSEAESKLLN